MMHNKSFNTVFIITAVVCVALAAPHHKDESDLKQKIGHSGGLITRNGNTVLASWGGFDAFASLADDGSAVVSAGGNGLGSGAGYGAGGVGAGAGAGYGSSASASAGVYGAGSSSSAGALSGGKPFVETYGHGAEKPGSAPLYYHGAPRNDFYDKIFAIPINVLQSVNTYLNQKSIQGQKGAVVHSHVHNSGAVSTASASASSSVL